MTNMQKQSLSLRERLHKLKKQHRLRSAMQRWLVRRLALPLELGQYSIFRVKSSRWDIKHIRRASTGQYVDIPNKVFERIAASYTHMKKGEATAAAAFLPSVHWQRYVDRSFMSMRAAIENNDRHVLSQFLSSFLNRDLGIEFEATRATTGPSAIRYVNRIRSLYKMWLGNMSDPNIARLEVPKVGNPNGYALDGLFVTSGAFGNDIWSSKLAQLAGGSTRPVICEIGGGYGKLAHRIVEKLPRCTYIGFDIPEMSVVMFYFLSSLFPGGRFLLPGEGMLTDQPLSEFDFILFPGYAIETLPDESVNLIINKNSFGEMNRETVTEFLSHVNRCTKKYFYSVNHEYFPDTASDDPGLAGTMYSSHLRGFDLTFRQRDAVHSSILGASSDIFERLYKKSSSRSQNDV